MPKSKAKKKNGAKEGSKGESANTIVDRPGNVAVGTSAPYATGETLAPSSLRQRIIAVPSTPARAPGTTAQTASAGSRQTRVWSDTETHAYASSPAQQRQQRRNQPRQSRGGQMGNWNGTDSPQQRARRPTSSRDDFDLPRPSRTTMSSTTTSASALPDLKPGEDESERLPANPNPVAKPIVHIRTPRRKSFSSGGAVARAGEESDRSIGDLEAAPRQAQSNTRQMPQQLPRLLEPSWGRDTYSYRYQSMPVNQAQSPRPPEQSRGRGAYSYQYQSAPFNQPQRQQSNNWKMLQQSPRPPEQLRGRGGYSYQYQSAPVNQAQRQQRPRDPAAEATMASLREEKILEAASPAAFGATPQATAAGAAVKQTGRSKLGRRGRRERGKRDRSSSSQGSKDSKKKGKRVKRTTTASHSPRHSSASPSRLRKEGQKRLLSKSRSPIHKRRRERSESRPAPRATARQQQEGAKSSPMSTAAATSPVSPTPCPGQAKDTSPADAVAAQERPAGPRFMWPPVWKTRCAKCHQPFQPTSTRLGGLDCWAAEVLSHGAAYEELRLRVSLVANELVPVTTGGKWPCCQADAQSARGCRPGRHVPVSSSGGGESDSGGGGGNADNAGSSEARPIWV
ncbi:hypothetical protein GGR56DRAFT_50472 [Xylariaceae sp. FL0804]|nr:hypothetical protein GGR56DRAFT_50472 [Xylariaceae sp. FL0804]